MSSSDKPGGSKGTTAAADLSLEDLLKVLENGPPESASAAIQEVLRRFQPVLLSFWRNLRCGEYEDFVQEVVLRLFKALPSLTDHKAFPGFFRRIVVGAAADYWRHEGSPDQGREDQNFEAIQAAFDHDVMNRLIVRALLDRLPKNERNVLELTFLDDLDSESAATQLGLTAGGVRVLKSRAIKRLRAFIEKEQSR